MCGALAVILLVPNCQLCAVYPMQVFHCPSQLSFGHMSFSCPGSREGFVGAAKEYAAIDPPTSSFLDQYGMGHPRWSGCFLQPRLVFAEQSLPQTAFIFFSFLH